MKALWNLTIDDYMEVYKRAKANGKKPGDSMEQELFEYAKEKGLKPIGHTELSVDELLKEQASHGKKVLGMETKDGKTIYKKVKNNDSTDSGNIK